MSSAKNEQRKAEAFRKTKETEIRTDLNLDGNGKANIETGIPFFDHLLKNFTTFSLFNLNLKAAGDLEVDAHHTVEDTGIALGEAFRLALGEREQICRLGFCYVPFDETLVRVSLDISGRPSFHFSCPKSLAFEAVDFLRAFAHHSMVTLSVEVIRGENNHHIAEAIFKGLGYSLRQATRIDPRIEGVPSTK